MRLLVRRSIVVRGFVVSFLRDSAVKKYYDDKGATYDAYSRQFWSRVYDAVTWKITEPYVPKGSEALVFDAAGGTGKWAIPIAKRGPRVIIGDISEGMLNVAKRKIAEEGLVERVEVKECDLRSLDFEDETFDMVFCEHALCFIKEQEAVIKELVRVLKRSHPLIITGQNRYVLSLSIVSEDAGYAMKVLSTEKPFIMRHNLEVHALSPEEFRQMLENNGVKVDRMVGKLFTMPLGIPFREMTREDFTEETFEQIMRVELELADKPDSVSLAGHIQAIGYRRSM
jgi:ubiquinone/menaquinone biosynthesis C-methylase UbiE